MTRFWDEQFEATGYDETWSSGETVAGSSSLDEDYATSSVTGAPADWDSKCLRSNMVSDAACYVQHFFAAAHTVSYARIEFIWGSFPDALAQFGTHIFAQQEDSGGVACWQLKIQERGASNDGPYRLQFYENAAGTGLTAHHSSSYEMSADTRYRIEVKWDGSANEWEFRFDGATAYSGTIDGGPTDIQDDLRIGLGAGGGTPGNAELFFDNIAFDDTDWIGAEAGAGNAAIIRRRREDY